MAENINKVFVIDASFILNYLLPDEKKTQVDDIVNLYIKRSIDFISTTLFPFEVLNSLRILILRKRLTDGFAAELAKLFFKLDIIYHEIDMYRTFLLAQKYNLTVYNASYVCLAKEKGIKLLTFDAQLQQLPIAEKII